MHRHRKTLTTRQVHSTLPSEQRSHLTFGVCHSWDHATIHTCMHTHALQTNIIRVYIHTYVCAYIHMSIQYTHVHKGACARVYTPCGRQTNRHKDRLTDRQTCVCTAPCFDTSIHTYLVHAARPSHELEAAVAALGGSGASHFAPCGHTPHAEATAERGMI